MRSGMGMASSVHRVVLSSTDRSDVVQPLSESQARWRLNSAFDRLPSRPLAQCLAWAMSSDFVPKTPIANSSIVVVGDNHE